VVEAELQHLDSMVEDQHDVVCTEAEVVDYRNYYKFVVKEKLGVYDVIRESYIPKKDVTVVVIPVEVIVREVDNSYIRFVLAKAQYFITDTMGCYKYHRIDYDDMLEASRAIITNSLAEAGETVEVEEGGDKSGEAGNSVLQG
jgi:hypothetical protein